MPIETSIEQRLLAVEAAVVDLQRRLPGPRQAPGWLDQIIGSFKDEPAFDEVIAHGRRIRESDRPGGDDA